MSDFKERLIEERAQLAEKAERLNNFLMTDKADEIDNVQHTLLDVQLPAMRTYLKVLDERIRLLG
jgi:hypothetical protein